MFIDLENDIIRQYSKTAEYGIERESLRVNRDGTPALSSHPFPGDKYIDRDFCEDQIEIITDVFTNADALINQLNDIHDRIDEKLAARNELLWCFSNPPVITSEDDIPVAVFPPELEHKNEYRRYLAKKYGKKKMMFSGIHFNFSFNKKFVDAACSLSGKKDRRAFADELYLTLAQRLVKYSWLAVYLTAASPVTHESLGIPSAKYSSVRCGDKGYWNDFVPVLDHSSLEGYIESIEEYISDGRLRGVSELYYPVRVKPRGENSLDVLREKGINHIELRVTDVNPLSRAGIFKEDIEFYHLLMLYLLSIEGECCDEEEQIKAIEDAKAAALYHNDDIKERAKNELEKISLFAEKYYPGFIGAVRFQCNKLKNGRSYAEIVNKYFGIDYIDKGLRLADSYRRRDKQCVNCSVFLPRRNTMPTNI